MSSCAPHEFSQTSNHLTLDAWDGDSSTFAHKRLLSVSAMRPSWRIVELVSRSKAPFEVSLSWGAGGASGASALLTVPRCTRIGLFARSLEIQVGNLSDAANTVLVAIADTHSFVQTRNQHEYRGVIEDDGSTEVEIPPFASHVRLDCHDHTALPDMRLRLVDGQGTTRLYLPADQLPQDGLPVGGAHKVLSHVTAGTVLWRVVFLLSL